MTNTTALERGLNLPCVSFSFDAYTFSQNDAGALDVVRDGDSDEHNAAYSGFRHYGLVPRFTDAAKRIVFVKVPAGADVRVSNDGDDALLIELFDELGVIATLEAEAQPVVVAHHDVDGDALRARYAGAFGHQS